MVIVIIFLQRHFVSAELPPKSQNPKIPKSQTGFHFHHIFPFPSKIEFRNYFEQAGIENVDWYTIPLDWKEHRDLVHQVYDEEQQKKVDIYNEKWKKFKEEHPNPTVDQLFEAARQFLDQAGFEHRRFKFYYYNKNTAPKEYNLPKERKIPQGRYEKALEDYFIARKYLEKTPQKPGGGTTNSPDKGGVDMAIEPIFLFIEVGDLEKEKEKILNSRPNDDDVFWDVEP